MQGKSIAEKVGGTGSGSSAKKRTTKPTLRSKPSKSAAPSASRSTKSMNKRVRGL